MKTKQQRPARISIARVALGAVIVLMWSPCALGLDVPLELAQYSHRAWTTRDGLTGLVRSIAQTPDGYLWLGTEFGLVRFDGVRFSPWIPPAGPDLPANNILSLLATRDGSLWIGTARGLASWNNGKSVQYRELADEPVFSLLEDHEGTVWVGGRGKVCAIRGGTAECSALGLDLPQSLRDVKRPFYGLFLGTRGVHSLYEDRERRIWAGSESGLWQWKPGPSRRVLTQPVYMSQSLAEGDHAQELLAITNGILRRVGGKNTAEYAVSGLRGPFATHSCPKQVF